MKSRALIAAGVLLLAGCSQPDHRPALGSATPGPSTAASPAASPTAGATPFPSIMLHARRSGANLVSIVVTQGARKLYTITADSNESSRASNGSFRSRFAKPSVVFFNKDGGKMTATADQADVDGATKVVTMQGNVEMHGQDGTTLHCRRLRYDDHRDTVEGWGDVVVKTLQNDTLRGEHFTGDLHLEHVRIDGAQ